jgi:hypothetical protein
MTSLETLAKQVHEITVNKGFWDGFHELEPFPFYAYKLAMINSEVTEVLEAIRKDKGDEEVVLEIVDILIRVLDLYEGLKNTKEIEDTWDLDAMMAKKIVVNQARPERHGVRG